MRRSIKTNEFAQSWRTIKGNTNLFPGKRVYSKRNRIFTDVSEIQSQFSESIRSVEYWLVVNVDTRLSSQKCNNIVMARWAKSDGAARLSRRDMRILYWVARVKIGPVKFAQGGGGGGGQH